MKRISLIFIMGCLFLNISNAQSLTEQIEQAYNRLITGLTLLLILTISYNLMQNGWIIWIERHTMYL